jgi:heptosyltransferase-2
VIVYDKRGADDGASGVMRVARRVRAADRNAVAYLAQGSLRSAALAVVAVDRHRVGFNTSAGAWLYTRRITYRRDQHHSERLLRLAVGDDAVVSPDELAPSLFPSDGDCAAVSELLASHGATGRRLIGLAPGSIWATKRWPGFPALASSLSAHGRVVIIGAADDRDLATTITSTTPNAIDATGRLSLLASAELIRRTALLVTNDSFPSTSPPQWARQR